MKALYMKLFNLKPVKNLIRDGKIINTTEIRIINNQPHTPLKIQKRQVVNSKGNRDNYINHLKATGKAETTIYTYLVELRYWDRESKKLNTKLQYLNCIQVENIIKDLDKNTAKKRISALSSYAKYMLRQDKSKLYIELQKLNPIGSKTRIPKHKTQEEYVELYKQAKNLCKAKDRLGVWLGLFVCCGVRISEIEKSLHGSNFVQVIGKGDKERRIPAPKWLLNAMIGVNQRERGGWRKKRQVIDKTMRKLLGISNCHSLRHTYATVLLNAGVKLEEIQLLLGHEKMDTTQIYAKTRIPKGIIVKLENLSNEI